MGDDNSAKGPFLSLQDTNGHSITLTAENNSSDKHASENQARFQLPATMNDGVYTVMVANSLAPSLFTTMDTFVTPQEPHVSTVTIKTKQEYSSPDPRQFVGTGCQAIPPTVVAIHPPGGSRIPPPRRIVNGQNVAKPVESTSLLKNAIDQVAKAGGGTVFLSRGQYYVDSGFEVPDNVYIKGAGMTSVTLFLKEGNFSQYKSKEDVMKRGFVFKGANPHLQRWGVSDLQVVATSFYGNIFVDGELVCNDGQESPDGSSDAWNCTSTARGFTLQRVRVRGVAYFAYTGSTFRPRPNVDFNFTLHNVGSVVILTGSDWVVQDCDIFGTGDIFSQDSSSGGLHGTSWGRLSRNQVQHGGGAVFMNAWKQVIIEDNSFRAVALYAAGNTLATYNGGYQQHVAMLNNTLEGIWGGDREVMTNDGPGAAYFGSLSHPSAQKTSNDGSDASNTVTTTSPRIPVSRRKGCRSDKCGWVTKGGLLVVLNGTGAGQVRRVVREPAKGKGVWVLDSPLDPVDYGPGGSYVEISPYRGRNVFRGNTFRDVGCFQIWGIGLTTIVADNRFERAAGLISWGQWRGWNGHEDEHTAKLTPGVAKYTAELTPGVDHQYAELTPGVGVGALQGEGAQPSWFNSFTGNVFTEPGVVNYATTEVIGGFDFGMGFNLASVSGLDAQKQQTPDKLSMNAFNIFRGNSILSNGGILIAGDASDTLVEGNAIAYPGGYIAGDLGICVQNMTRNVMVRGNDAPVTTGGLCGAAAGMVV